MFFLLPGFLYDLFLSLSDRRIFSVVLSKRSHCSGIGVWMNSCSLTNSTFLWAFSLLASGNAVECLHGKPNTLLCVCLYSCRVQGGSLFTFNWLVRFLNNCTFYFFVLLCVVFLNIENMLGLSLKYLNLILVYRTEIIKKRVFAFYTILLFTHI